MTSASATSSRPPPTTTGWCRRTPPATTPDVEEVALELGLGRVRVLSPIGRDDAVDRWYAGTPGPEAPIAKAAPAPCGTCGFWLSVAGALRGFFGVCANEYAPDDSRVVAADHGCGAHSEALVISAAPGNHRQWRASPTSTTSIA